MKEKIAPTNDDKDDAAKRLAYWLDMDRCPDDAADSLRATLDKHVLGIEKAYAQRLGSEISILSNETLPRFLVDIMGVELFEGSAGRFLRMQLLQKVMIRKPRMLTELLPSSVTHNEKSSKDTAYDHILKRLTDPSRTKWRSNGRFARKFVDVLGFPGIFAGNSHDPPQGRVEEVYPRTPYFPLENFQENMKNQVLEILESKTDAKRAIVSLPTGAGKTKTVAEAILEFWKKMRKSGSSVSFVMWIAQTEELCEQAVSCFRQLWEEKGAAGVRLNIFRVWGGRGIPYPEEEGIIVAGIDQLQATVKKARKNENETSDLSMLAGNLGAVFIDEAHRSWAQKYLKVLRELGIGVAAGTYDRIPLIGLTATPERTASGETHKLHGLYGGKVIHPTGAYNPKTDKDGMQFDSRWSSLRYARERLTDLGFLAHARYHWEDPGRHFEMSPEETEDFEQKNVLSPSFLRKIGTDFKRNGTTYDLLKKWVEDEGRQVLFFGANVHQALLMSCFLDDDGISSATITGNTKYGARKAYVRMFREKRIRVLCNYEVLTTGFDMPKIDTVVIARPTSSRIVYSQMVGRGLRGPRFNGTGECDIITIEDDIQKNTHKRVDLGYMMYKNDQKECA